MRKCLTSHESIWASFQNWIVTQALSILILLDALDECNDPKMLLRNLLKLSASADVKVIATCRPGDHRKALESLKVSQDKSQSISMTDDDVRRDIISYLRAKVPKLETLAQPKQQDLKHHVITTLTIKSRGMFLWVYPMLKVLKHMPDTASIRKALKNLPAGLEGMYERILWRLETSLPPEELIYSKRVLAWIVASNRPMRVDTLREAIALEVANEQMVAGNDLDPPNEFLYTKKQISRLCGSLVNINQDDEIIQMIHLSTRESLTDFDCMAACEAASSIASFHINISFAEAKMCAVCLASLSSSTLGSLSQYEDVAWSSRDSEVARIRTEYPLFEYAVLYWPEYLIHPVKEKFLRRATLKMQSTISLQRVHFFGSKTIYDRPALRFSRIPLSNFVNTSRQLLGSILE